MAIKIANELQKYIEPVGDSRTVQDMAFKTLTHVAFDQLFNDQNTLDFFENSEFKNHDKHLLKNGLTSLMVFILEISKLNIIDDTVKNFLSENVKWKESRINSFIKMFNKYKNNIRSRLSRVNWQYPHIVDCCYEMRITNKSNTSEKINSIEFDIDLQLEKNGSQNENDIISFSCNPTQIQDLVQKLKECSKSVTSLGKKM